MIITYHGVDFFKVSFGDTTIAINPISKDSKLKGARFGSDITLVSLNSPEHNGSDSTSRGEKESFLINGPGEYEVSGVFIKGLLSKTNYGGEERMNTIYTVALEGMNLCFLGALGDATLSAEAKEVMDGIDVLFVPIGGDGVLDPAIAHKLSGPSLAAIAQLLHTADFELEIWTPDEGAQRELRAAGLCAHPLTSADAFDASRLDRWSTAIVAFHEHDWEAPVLARILERPCFTIGVLGSRTAQANRLARLAAMGFGKEALARVKGPVGSIPGAKSRVTLAIGILAELAGEAKAHGFID